MAESNSSSGIRIGTMIFLIFLILKLAEIGPVAKWSWWWVTSTIWITIVIVIGIAILVILLSAIFKN